jgi:hypothetical protein
MRTDAERLQIALDFVNGPDIEEEEVAHRNVSPRLREDIARFLGFPLLEDDQYSPDPEDRWPDCIGGSNYEVDIKIDKSVFEGTSKKHGLAEFIAFGPSSVPVPVKVLRRLQIKTRMLIHKHLAGQEINDLAEQLGGPYTVRDRDGALHTCITARPEIAFQWIVLLLLKGESYIQVCAAPDCDQFLVRIGRRQYCGDVCSQRVRSAKYYEDAKNRAKNYRGLKRRRAAAREMKPKKSSKQGGK